MITPKHAWLIFAVISEGMHWPSPEDSGEPLPLPDFPVAGSAKTSLRQPTATSC